MNRTAAPLIVVLALLSGGTGLCLGAALSPWPVIALRSQSIAVAGVVLLLWGLTRSLAATGRRGPVRWLAAALESPSALRVAACEVFAAQQALLLWCAASMAGSALTARLALLFLAADLPALLLGVRLARGPVAGGGEALFLSAAAASTAGKYAFAWATAGCEHGRLWRLALAAVALGTVAPPVLLARARRRYSHGRDTALSALFLTHAADAVAMAWAAAEAAGCRSAVPRNVQFLAFFLSLLGCLAVGVYPANLFFGAVDAPPADELQPLQASSALETAAARTRRRDAARHFFLWALLLVDMPFFSLRVVGWAVRGTDLSPFVLKNAALMAVAFGWLGRATTEQ